MNNLNQPTEPTTTNFKAIYIENDGTNPWMKMVNDPKLQESGVVTFIQDYAHIDKREHEVVIDVHGFPQQNSCIEAMVYWLYNKDVPIPKLPKCVSSRIHAPSRGWRNGGKGKTAPVIDGGWLKEKA